ncbi:MAG: zinc ABC transporter substrate-binding protein [Rhizobiaceae bacterium]|nr:zinc ABC transporter substrate-binding protein [Rhizobiaceae bacterium]
MSRTMLAATALAAVFVVPAQALEVVVSIKPLHSLVAGVMGDTGTPKLIVKGASSPHTYTMRPSDAAALEAAELVFWIGPGMEAFLEKPLAALGGDATSVEIAWQKSVTLLPLREGGPFEAHSHDGHDHEHADHNDDDDDHAHDEDHDHDEDQATDDHEHGTGPGQHTHGPEEFDMHLWLDPENAAAVVGVIETALVQADPANAAAYKANAEALRGRLEALTGEIDGELEPVRGKPFIVFHDAYQYFENRFGMPAAGSITVSPEVMPGAERLTQIRARIVEAGAACVFAEPQFEPRLVETLIEGTPARAGVLDPEAGAIEEGPELYFVLMRGIAHNLRACLSDEG